MALLSGWTGKDGYTGPDNKVVRQLEFTRELRTLVQSRIGPLWQVESLTTEAFSLVGLTASAASECVAAMKTEYTETLTIWGIDANGDLISNTQSVVTADIRGYPEGGGAMWRVDVDVNKNETAFSLFEAEA
jgi:hypothetical protein